MAIALVRRLLAAALLCAAPLAAHAQAWPAKPLKLVIPYPPGGLADTFARTLGQHLAERLGQPVVPENKPGGSLIIGTDAVAKSPADGYTLLLASSSSLALNASAFKKLHYDPVKDFSPVSTLFYTPLYLITSPEVRATSVKELIAIAKAKPGSLSFASLGHGSSLHLAGEMFKNLAGIDILHVAYKGTTTAMPDLLAGRVSMIFDGGAFLPQVQAGKLRVLAVTSTRRLESMPEVPTMAEAGVPGYEVVFWFGIVAPGGTPRPVIERLAKEIHDISRAPAFREKLTGFGNILYATNTPEEFGELVKKDIAMWAKVLRDAGVAPQ